MDDSNNAKRKRGRPPKVKPEATPKIDIPSSPAMLSGHHGLRAFPKSDQLKSHGEKS